MKKNLNMLLNTDYGRIESIFKVVGQGVDRGLNTDYGRIESSAGCLCKIQESLLNTDYGRIERLVWLEQ